MIEIDGSRGEGGGQILRSALSLSILTGQPFRICQIRANRKPKPGLQPQHLAGVRAAARISSAVVIGDREGSMELTFSPGPVRSGDYHFPIGTAGSTGLLLHAIYLPLALRGAGPSRLTLEGGTHVRTSPTWDFLEGTWAKFLAAMGLPIGLSLERRGFYPRGGGRIIADIPAPVSLRGLTLTSPITACRVVGRSVIASLPEHIAKRQANRMRQRLENAGIDCQITQEIWNGGPASAAILSFPEVPYSPTFVALGERGKPAEAVGDEVATLALNYIQGGQPVDEFSADQLLLPLVLAEGPSEYAVSHVTRHLLTNVDTVQLFLPRSIEVNGAEGEPGRVRIV